MEKLVWVRGGLLQLTEWAVTSMCYLVVFLSVGVVWVLMVIARVLVRFALLLLEVVPLVNVLARVLLLAFGWVLCTATSLRFSNKRAAWSLGVAVLLCLTLFTASVGFVFAAAVRGHMSQWDWRAVGTALLALLASAITAHKYMSDVSKDCNEDLLSPAYVSKCLDAAYGALDLSLQL